MKIAFTGAQGTGKSTLLNYLADNDIKEVEGYTYVKEVTRRIQKQFNLDINEKGSLTTQILIITDHIVNLRKPKVIMDRCILDALVYTRWLCDYNPGIEPWVYDYCENVFKSYIDKYDIIFYLKPEFDLVSDGVRSDDVSFRDDIAELFETYINNYDVEVVPLTGTVKQRISQIKKAIKSKKNEYSKTN